MTAANEKPVCKLCLVVHDDDDGASPLRARATGRASQARVETHSSDDEASAAAVTHWTRIFYQDVLGTAAKDGEGGALESTQSRDADRPQIGAGIEDTYARARSRLRRKGEVAILWAADGYPITATRYATPGAVRATLVVAGAVGVPQRFYHRFAEFASAAGYACMTLDYRGVGLSRPATLQGFRMDYFDWARLDLAAAVAAMRHPDIPLYVVGHSFGGHAFGLLPNQADVAGFYTFGTGAGWHGWMPLLERIKVLVMWNALGPMLTAWNGYLSWSLLGMGEDLPLDFYRRWKHWCRYPNYFFGDPAMRHLARDFDRVRTPVMAANSIDDRWAPPRSRDAFMAGYRNASRHTLDLDPGHLGMRSIGHMGYFRPDAVPLWESALAWLERQRPTKAAGGVHAALDATALREPRHAPVASASAARYAGAGGT